MKPSNISTILPFLRCPETGEPLHLTGNRLVSESGLNQYPINEQGIPIFAEHPQTEETKQQQHHYDKIYASYLTNLGYPHTLEYTQYLDRAFLQQLEAKKFGNTVELCCGSGEAFNLLQNDIEKGIGVDISINMLNQAQCKFDNDRFTFIQGDATLLPLTSNSFDTVFIFGGIHHVPDLHSLFSEIHRILKPEGNLYWREPVDDFWPWRALRNIIYRLSPMLQHESEHPLRYKEISQILEKTGLSLEYWQTFGLLGFCLFMNSDVLVFNRLLRFIPGIRKITRAATKIDHWFVTQSCMQKRGLQVVGRAQKIVIT